MLAVPLDLPAPPGIEETHAFSIARSLYSVFGNWAPLALVVGSVAVGYVLEYFLLRAFYRRAKARGWTGWRVFLEAMSGVTILWSTAAGLYLTLLLFPLSSNEELLANRTLVLLLIWSVTAVVSRVSLQLVRNYNEHRQQEEKTASLLTTMIRSGIYATGLLVALQYLGISIAPMLTALGVGGLAVALALRDTLANFFSGLQIIASRRLRVGDFIRLESGREGFVNDIAWLHTTIRDPINSLIVVPNEKLASAAFTNLSLPTEQTLTTASVQIAYGTDLARAEASSLEVATLVQAEMAPEAPPPFARFIGAKDVGIELTVFLYASEYGDFARIRHEFFKRLFTRYQQDGIALAYPPWAAASPEQLAQQPSPWSLPQETKSALPPEGR